jgi:hypothetical protein
MISAATGTVVAQQLLSLDVVAALHRWLLRLDTHYASTASALSSQSSQGDSSGAEGSSQSATELPPTPPSVPHSSGTPLAKQFALDALCTALEGIMTALCVLLETMMISRSTGARVDDLVLATMEQLLSSPAALMVAVRRGMSPEVQEAARGGRGAALKCSAAVCLLFRRAACVLSLTTGAQDMLRDGRGKEVSGQLARFLQAEENLPFLEPLCLPPVHGEPHTVP